MTNIEQGTRIGISNKEQGTLNFEVGKMLNNQCSIFN
jgi:hypothetical protein